ncbi:aldo/keto reductase [Kineosporia sp. J2-2]|uniref:Aldo/keto reductase n=1 Tax=Kineosporia corallincola TaxID=2835133 RepID=A0ABS5TFR2_9ACTN|nr:aldo/keto reductase [Kineosporia corallincola]MBT0769927.1 aldo/keto reductase [Kineosporia corallincola]
MTNQPTRITFHDGNSIPQLGLGVWQARPEQATAAVREALQAGYRHVDTAAAYENEEAVGAGLRESGVARDEVFVTTKVWNGDQGADAARVAAEKSLERLGLDHLDLLLIHWPCPAQNLYVETWQTFIALREQGLVRSIGVSNFTGAHLDRLVAETGVTPVLNQIELHPYFQQRPMRAEHERLSVVTESWSPLAQNQVLTDPVLEKIAARHGKSPAQVVIRWHLDNGLVVIPKSVTPSRIRDNADVFDFALDADDLAAIAELDRGGRIGSDPDHNG